MILLPAMDLLGGEVVRLRQGRFEKATIYPADPAEALSRFEAAGAEWAHVVDLDGARAGEPVQHDLLRKLAQTSSLKLQAAGGIRTANHIESLLESGIARVVVGSLCVKQPNLVRTFLESFGSDRVALSLDVRLTGGIPVVATHGWQEASGRSLWEVAADFPTARNLLLTDIGRDGMLEGPNLALLEEAAERLPHLAIQASGGVSSLDDLRRLRTPAAILGRALWEGRIDLAEALRACA